MRVAPIRRALEELLKKRPPPPSPMRRLPSATHGYPFGPSLTGMASLPRTPPRVTKPPRLEALEARAHQLANRRRLMLERPELHRDHQHHHPNPLLADVYAYVNDWAPTMPPLPQASPFDRWVVRASVPSIEASIKQHQWGKQARANDIRRMVELEPRGWR